MATETIHAPAPPVGVIESISRGFETVAGHLALMLLPVLLDLFLWVGPRISLQDYYLDVWLPMFQVVETTSTDAQPALATMPENPEELIPDVQFWPLPLAPSLLSRNEAAALPFTYTPPVWSVHSHLSFFLLFILGTVGGIVLVTLYLSIIATRFGG